MRVYCYTVPALLCTYNTKDVALNYNAKHGSKTTLVVPVKKPLFKDDACRASEETPGYGIQDEGACTLPQDDACRAKEETPAFGIQGRGCCIIMGTFGLVGWGITTARVVLILFFKTISHF